MEDGPERDQHRKIDGLGYPPAAGDDASFAVPALIIAAILIVGGYFVVTYNSDTVRTASNNTPAVQRTAPAPTPAPPVAPVPKQ